jgi:hypothetical protein
MEKRYLIKEQGECDPGIVLTGTITESELKRRLSKLQYESARSTAPLSWDEQIYILLHGEGKEPFERASEEPYKPFPGPDDILAMRGKKLQAEFTNCIFDGPPPEPFKSWSEWEVSKPRRFVTIRANGIKKLSTPTRKEWAHNLADAIYYRASPDILSERLLSIPCAKEPEKYQCEYATVCKDDPQRADYCPLRGTPQDPGGETHDQWIERMPIVSHYRLWDQWCDAMKQWHREEPR